MRAAEGRRGSLAHVMLVGGRGMLSRVKVTEYWQGKLDRDFASAWLLFGDGPVKCFTSIPTHSGITQPRIYHGDERSVAYRCKSNTTKLGIGSIQQASCP